MSRLLLFCTMMEVESIDLLRVIKGAAVSLCFVYVVVVVVVVDYSVVVVCLFVVARKSWWYLP